MTEDRVRVLRVLEYEGPRSWVEAAMAERSVKGVRRFANVKELPGGAVIREAIMGETPEVLVKGAQDGAVEKSRGRYPPYKYPACGANLGQCSTRCEPVAKAPVAPAPVSKRIYHHTGCPMRPKGFYTNTPQGDGPCTCSTYQQRAAWYSGRGPGR